MSKSKKLAKIDTHRAAIHLKRALGQITGKNQITADGQPVKELLVPESINTVIVGGQSFLLASPITPLNWAKASLRIALEKFEEQL